MSTAPRAQLRRCAPPSTQRRGAADKPAPRVTADPPPGTRCTASIQGQVIFTGPGTPSTRTTPGGSVECSRPPPPDHPTPPPSVRIARARPPAEDSQHRPADTELCSLIEVGAGRRRRRSRPLHLARMASGNALKGAAPRDSKGCASCPRDAGGVRSHPIPGGRDTISTARHVHGYFPVISTMSRELSRRRAVGCTRWKG